MATYTPASRSTPSFERVVQFTSVVAGDRLDMIEALGRPARVVQMFTSATTDVIDYKINNKITRFVAPTTDQGETAAYHGDGIYGKTETEIWSQADRFPTFSVTGSTLIENGAGLSVSSMEIIGLTGPASITIVAW